MQLETARILLGMYVEPILAKIFRNETGAARLQQLGLFLLVFVLEKNGEPVTAKRLSEATGHPNTSIHKQMQKLLKVGVVGKRKGTSSGRRGYALHFFVMQNAKTKQLLKAIDKAAARKR